MCAKDLVKELMALGFSRRRAIKALQGVVDCCTRALNRGEEVEIPGGTIQAVAAKGRSTTRISRRYLPDKKRVGYIAIKRLPPDSRRIRFTPDENFRMDE